MADLRTASILELQPDWDLAVREQRPSIWISHRQDKSSKILDELLKLSYSNGKVTSIHGTENFNVSYDPKIRNRIVAVHTSSGVQCEFVSSQQTWPIHSKGVNCMDVSPSGGLCVSSSEEGEVLVWEAGTGQVRRKLSGHVGDVYSCRFYPSGEVVLTGGADFRLRIWSVADGSCPRLLSGHRARVTGTQIVERGKNVLSASLDGSVRLWDCGSGSCVAVLAQVRYLCIMMFNWGKPLIPNTHNDSLKKLPKVNLDRSFFYNSIFSIMIDTNFCKTEVRGNGKKKLRSSNNGWLDHSLL